MTGKKRESGSERIQRDISAIIPVADRPLLLREAIDSILAGSRWPAEIIVVVDSRDARAEADARAARQAFDSLQHTYAPRTQIIFSAGQGVAAARNLGARQAAGDWLAFLDSDDLWTPEKLERQQSYLARRPQLHVCQTGEQWWKQGRFLSQPRRLRPRPGSFLRDAWRTCLVSLSSTLIRKNFFFATGAFDESFSACEDFEFWLRVLVQEPIGLVPEGLVIKRSGGWPQLSAAHSLDALRIRAILKTVANQSLTEAQRIQARDACLEKIEILHQGAARRDQPEKFRELERQIQSTFGPNLPDRA